LLLLLDRASKKHGEGMSPALSSVLVDARDKRFAAAISNFAAVADRSRDNARESESGSGERGRDEGGSCVVGVFGLVHLDGVREDLC